MTKFRCIKCGRKSKHENLTFIYLRRHTIEDKLCSGNLKEDEWIDFKETHDWYIQKFVKSCKVPEKYWK